MPEILKPADFRDLDSPLSLDTGEGGRVALAVHSVKPLPPHRYREEPFSLMLAGPASAQLAQATYRVEHPVLGAMDLFLVPVAREGDAVHYEVTFN